MHTETLIISQRLVQKHWRVRSKNLGESLREIAGVNSSGGREFLNQLIHGVHSQRVLILNHGICRRDNNGERSIAGN